MTLLRRRAAALVSVLLLLALAPRAAAQAPAASARDRVAPPGLAARLGLMPLVTTNVPGFRSANPTFDGRGVVIGILDSGLDPSIPGLLQTTTGETKILDLRDFSGEGRIALAPVVPAGDAVQIGGLSLGGAAAWTARSSSPWFGGVLRERPLGELPASDLNADGDDEDALAVLVLRLEGEWMVLVDRDGDGSLAGEQPVRDFLRARESFFWTPKTGAPALALAVNLADVPGEAAPVLDLYFDTSAHGSHVAGIAAGHDIYGVAGFDGVAPGAWLLGLKISDNAQGGVTTSGSMARAMSYAIRFATERRLPLVLNMSFGVGNEREGRARIDAIIDSILIANPGVVFTIAAGNDGPGLSTLGFPGSASRAIGVGATMPAIFRPGAEGPGAAQEPTASFSSRGGELAKPDFVTPGVAYSTVPGWNTGDEIKGGTSMAAPHAAGLAARLMSGLVQRSLPIDAARIRLALEATARAVPSAERPDAGAGRPDLLRAWQWLITPHDVEPLVVGVSGAVPGTSALLRRGPAPSGDTTVVFTLERVRPGPARRLLLASSVPWLQAPEAVTLEGDRVEVPILVRGGGDGFRSGDVVVRAAADTAAGPLARLGITLLTPAPLATPITIEAPLNGTARSGVPVQAGRAFAVEIESVGDPAGADVHLYEPDGRPWRDGQSRALSADAETPTVFAIDARDADEGLYEVVLRAADAGPAKAALTVHAAPFAITAVERAGAVVRVTGRAFGGLTKAGPTAHIVGAERVMPVEARAGLPRRLPIALPAWVRRVRVDVEMPRAQWSRFTDLGVTLFDAEGRQLGKEPMNYPGVRFDVDSLPDAVPGRAITLGLFPGLADPSDEGAWSATVTVRFMGADETLLRPLPPDGVKVAAGLVRWRFALPATSVPVLPEGARPLIRIAGTSGGVTFTHELPLPAAAASPARPAARPRSPKP